MASIPILCINVNVNITIDAMLKFDANSDANDNIDAQCERALTILDVFTEGAGAVPGRAAVVGGGSDGVGPGMEPRGGGRLLVPALHRHVRRRRRTVGRQR